ncbi:oligoendopeptidase F [Collibacillus ludicampi]|uniref:Oligopeptidase F n=1 Tax=Collibacillus ludicampi TaxID=2771369 RepID=A0AAV4LID7_9BACL|nr:oligoendopeptidase F [Collibacillus ludicampi]GIM47229.1 oligoendopeptidase F [Collibacillus ludicampi]
MAEQTTRTLPKRSEIADEYKWALEDMYPNDQVWEEDARQAKEWIEKIRTYKGTLGSSGKRLLEVLQLQDDIHRIVQKLYVYAHMRRDEDTANPHYQALSDRSSSLSVTASEASSYIVPEILSLDAETLNRFINEEEGLELYRFQLEEITRQREHFLSPAEEQILAQAGEIAHGPQTVFGMLNNADITFPTIRDENGQEVELTKGNFIHFLESRDRRVRKDAYNALYSSYRKHKNTLAALFHASVKKDVFYARVRKYNSALEASLDVDNIPTEVYDNLIATIHEHLPLMYRYVSLRKKVLGIDDLHFYDLYVPIVQEVDIKVPYEKAKELVAEGLKPLGEEYIKILKEGFSSKWIDVYENQGKRSGAYSWGAYDVHPYVLLNYQETLDNAFTLAHEMGHAIHSYYTNKNQPFTYADYTIFVAEVASTVNESLLIDYMLKKTTDPREKLYLLNHYLEQFRGTVFRQTMFAEFEKITHEKVEAGEALTPEQLCAIYRELNEKYYGPELVLDENIEIEWARIPHFYNAFYVYKYATGFSAATSLATQILEEGQPAVERYLGFLKAGSSDYSINLLKKAGVDMTTPQPIRDALGKFKQLLDELEQLIG